MFYTYVLMSSKETIYNKNVALANKKKIVSAHSACTKTKFLQKKLENQDLNEKILNFLCLLSLLWSAKQY